MPIKPSILSARQYKKDLRPPVERPPWSGPRGATPVERPPWSGPRGAPTGRLPERLPFPFYILGRGGRGEGCGSIRSRQYICTVACYTSDNYVWCTFLHKGALLYDEARPHEPINQLNLKKLLRDNTYRRLRSPKSRALQMQRSRACSVQTRAFQQQQKQWQSRNHPGGQCCCQWLIIWQILPTTA